MTTDLKKITLYPGQFLVTASPALITTVLGSCVAVCLWDKVRKVAAMNHFLLPGVEHEISGNGNNGVAATSMLIHAMIRRQCSVENIEAKIFGGCNSIYVHQNDQFQVGKRNAEVAGLVLRHYQIPIVARQVGGELGRKIILNTTTGKVQMVLLKKLTELHEKNQGLNY